jgi:hypothetical protein
MTTTANAVVEPLPCGCRPDDNPPTQCEQHRQADRARGLRGPRGTRGTSRGGGR